MNWTHADHGFVQRFTLDPTIMRTWGLKMWAVFLALVLLIAWLFYDLAADYTQVQVLTRYVAWWSLLVGAIKWNTQR